MAHVKKKARLFAGMVFLLICLPVVAYGAAPVSKWASLKFINTDELKKMYDAKEDFQLINTLSPIEFDEIAIKGSVNLPYEHINRGTQKLPDDKNSKLVFYCKGPK